MRLWSILTLALLLAGCTDPTPTEDVASLDGREDGPHEPPGSSGPPSSDARGDDDAEAAAPEPWEWEYEGRLVGAGRCDASSGSFIGISSFSGDFRVPARTESLDVRLTWDMPVPVCLYLTDPAGNRTVVQSDPSQQLAGTLELEVDAAPGAWSVWVAATGAAAVEYAVHVEGR